MAVDLHAPQIVSHPDWYGGRPVRVLDALVVDGDDGAGIGVRYQDVGAHECAHQVTVPLGMELTLVSGGCVRGAR